jgi:hypothetical protein
MHKTSTKMSKATMIIIYLYGINFLSSPKVITRWQKLFMVTSNKDYY